MPFGGASEKAPSIGEWSHSRAMLPTFSILDHRKCSANYEHPQAENLTWFLRRTHQNSVEWHFIPIRPIEILNSNVGTMWPRHGI